MVRHSAAQRIPPRLPRRLIWASTIAVLVAASGHIHAQAPPQTPSASTNSAPVAPAPSATVVPSGFVIGPADVLTIVYWRDKDMSTDVVVRPDGRITLPLLNEITAAGLTPIALRDFLMTESKRFLANPNISVIVKQINSRKVFITGEVTKPGTYNLEGPTNVLQLISMAGGLTTFTHGKDIVIVRQEDGQTQTIKFNYTKVGKNQRQTIVDLKPGDMVVVR
jgi:polysaccharide export outer membrane protein